MHIWRVKYDTVKASVPVGQLCGVHSMTDIARFKAICPLGDLPPKHTIAISHVCNRASRSHVERKDMWKETVVTSLVRRENQFIGSDALRCLALLFLGAVFSRHWRTSCRNNTTFNSVFHWRLRPIPCTWTPKPWAGGPAGGAAFGLNSGWRVAQPQASRRSWVPHPRFVRVGLGVLFLLPPRTSFENSTH